MPNRRTRDRHLSKLAARRAAERRKKRRQRMVATGVAVAVAAIGLGFAVVVLLKATKKTTHAASSPSPSPSSAAQVACAGTVPPASLVNKPTFSKPPKMTIDPKKTYTATVVTSCGTIQLELFAKDAPIAVNSFVFLAKQHFYDGLTFHRIATNPPVIQGGDPKGDGTGGPGYKFKDENNNNLKYDLGTIAMANSGPNTNGSQFFIMTAADSSLSHNYTIFGNVTKGQDVVAKISKVPTNNEKPTETVYILKITISTS